MYLIKELVEYLSSLPFSLLFFPSTSGLFHLMASDLKFSISEFIWSEEHWSVAVFRFPKINHATVYYHIRNKCSKCMCVCLCVLYIIAHSEIVWHEKCIWVNYGALHSQDGLLCCFLKDWRGMSWQRGKINQMCYTRRLTWERF